jgi:hypothetical protein
MLWQLGKTDMMNNVDNEIFKPMRAQQQDSLSDPIKKIQRMPTVW